MDEILPQQTRSHYDEYPFISGGQNRIRWWREYLEDFFDDQDVRGSNMADIGSSVGEISRGLIDRGGKMSCLDLSIESLRDCRRLNPEAEIFHGSALELPFADETFDHAISIGVLHHTPECRRGFGELARITAPGGKIVLFLYNYWSIYNPIYNGFRPIRRAVPLEKVPVWMVRLMQPFAQTHLKQPLDDEQLRNLLGDKLWTPQATFHSIAELKRWAAEEGLDFVMRKRFYLGYANVLLLQKRGDSRGGVQEVTTRCVQCGHAPMIKKSDGFDCPQCRQGYPMQDGIFRCTDAE